MEGSADSFFMDESLSYSSAVEVLAPPSFSAKIAVDSQMVIPVQTLLVREVDQSGSLVYGVENNFQLGFNSGGLSENNPHGSFKVLHSYDLEKVGDTGPYDDIVVALSFSPISKLDLSYASKLSVSGDELISHDLATRYTTGRGDSIGVHYVYNPSLTKDMVRGMLSLVLSDSLSLQGEVSQSFARDQMFDSKVGLIYQPDWWKLQLNYADIDDESQVSVLFSLY